MLDAVFSDEFGLPLSAQIIGAPFAEAVVLRAGYAYQQVTDWHRRCRPRTRPVGTTREHGRMKLERR